MKTLITGADGFAGRHFRKRLEALDAAPGVGVQARVHQVHDPVFASPVVGLNLPRGEVDRHAAIEPVVIEEIPLNDVPFVSEGDVELSHPKVVVMLHDMPENWPAPNFHHGLRLHFGLFGKPCAQATGKNDNLHAPCPQLRLELAA